MNHPLRRSNTRLTGAAITAAVVLAAACGGGSSDNTSMDQATETAQARNQTSLAAQGRHIFRFETFGDEAKWTDALRMHEVIRTSVDPLTRSRSD